MEKIVKEAPNYTINEYGEVFNINRNKMCVKDNYVCLTVNKKKIRFNITDLVRSTFPPIKKFNYCPCKECAISERGCMDAHHCVAYVDWLRLSRKHSATNIR